MTTRVVRGGLWSFGGQALMLLASLVATPFNIRLLGTEAFGILQLVNTVVNSLGFADFGMGNASTKFGSEAHQRGDDRGEAAAVWTSLFIAAVPTLVLCCTLIVLAPWLVTHWLHLPAHLHPIVIPALRIAAFSFMARTAANILNTPQLARLRIDLNTLLNTGTMLLQVALVPMTLWLGGGLVTVILVIAVVSVVGAVLQWIVSGRLLPALWRPCTDPQLWRPLLKFGGPAVITALAALVLANAEKLLLVRHASATALAHYQVAFNIASLLTIAPVALNQTLMPAFSRLQSQTDRAPLQQLVTRAMRGNLLWIAPVAVVMMVVARPFLTIWAGPEYGRESTVPFYVLVVTFSIHVLAYVPYILLIAQGRTGFTAKFHCAEVPFYLVYSSLLVQHFGALGAALTWAVRIATACCVLFLLAPRQTGIAFSPQLPRPGFYFLGLGVLALPLLMLRDPSLSFIWTLLVTVMALVVYAMVVWHKLLSDEERAWLPHFLRR